MSAYTFYNAKIHLSGLIDQACSGEDVITAKGKIRKQRQFGAMQGQVRVTDVFFEPLPGDELDAWTQ